MDEHTTALGEGASTSRARRAASSRDRPLAVAHRRRRAAALLVVAGLALLAGLGVGAASGSKARSRVPPVTTSHSVQTKALAVTGPRSFAAAERAAENAAINRTLAYTPLVRAAGSQHREIALTFDDGPGPYTPDVVRALERERAPGTFFEVGIAERWFHASTAAIVARGYPIGDHTEDHLPMSQLSRRRQEAQLLGQVAAIGDYGAPFPRLFRPPYGVWNSTTLALLRRFRMLMVLWSVDPSDYLMPGVQAIVHRVIEGARPGAIILLHDAGGNRSQTVAALPKIIAGLRRRGYRLVTVPRLLLDNPAPRDQDLGGLQGAGG